MQHHVGQIGIGEFIAVEQAFQTARQPFTQTRVAGVLVLRPVAGGDAVIPAAVPGHGEVLTIDTVSLFTVVLLHQRVVVVGVLRVARIQVVLAAVARFKLQRLHRREVPAHHAVDVFIFHTFTACGQGVGVSARAVRLVTLVNVPGVGLGFIQVTVHAEAEIPAQRAAQAEVGAFGGTFVFMLWRVQVGVPGAVPLVVKFFGDDVHHAARRTITVAGSSRATDHFDALDHLRRDPAGIAAGITLAAPAQTDGVAAGDRLAVDQDQGVFRAHAANVNLTVVPALAAGGVTGQVNARHGADDFRHVARWRVFADLIGGDGRHARRLQILLGGSDHHGVFVLRGGGVVVCHGGQRDTINP
ncbi:Uncharacterised protein [Enterobacter hormaechei]|nr:Uncharacterised protein [Enterobacter hormaechei]